MKLKKYVDFITESFNITDKKTDIKKILSMLKGLLEKNHISARFGIYDREHLRNRSKKYIADSNDNVFFELYLDRESDPGIEYIQENLSKIIPNANLYNTTDEMAVASSMYLIGFNFEETINNEIVRSNMGINKYQL